MAGVNTKYPKPFSLLMARRNALPGTPAALPAACEPLPEFSRFPGPRLRQAAIFRVVNGFERKRHLGRSVAVVRPLPRDCPRQQPKARRFVQVVQVGDSGRQQAEESVSFGAQRAQQPERLPSHS